MKEEKIICKECGKKFKIKMPKSWDISPIDICGKCLKKLGIAGGRNKLTNKEQ